MLPCVFSLTVAPLVLARPERPALCMYMRQGLLLSRAIHLLLCLQALPGRGSVCTHCFMACCKSTTDGFGAAESTKNTDSSCCWQLVQCNEAARDHEQLS